MRITCPNCGAQYEVPDEVIPAEGRDVQCSNCGDTWFQAHPDSLVVAEPAAPEAVPEVEPDFVEPAPEPEPGPQADMAEEAAPPTPQRRELDPEVGEILREEAELEVRRRAEEAGSLESQGEFGLDTTLDDEASRREREARERMARMRGEEAEEDDGQPRNRSRLLPDIDEINSTLRSDGSAEPPLPPAVAEKPERRGGFARGFGIVLLIAILLVLAYGNAADISALVPALEGVMTGYVSQVDSLRLWLDSRLSGFIPE